MDYREINVVAMKVFSSLCITSGVMSTGSQVSRSFLIYKRVIFVQIKEDVLTVFLNLIFLLWKVIGTMFSGFLIGTFGSTVYVATGILGFAAAFTRRKYL